MAVYRKKQPARRPVRRGWKRHARTGMFLFAFALVAVTVGVILPHAGVMSAAAEGSTLTEKIFTTVQNKNLPVIAIDPGHGGTDVGAIGHKGNKEIYEKDVTLSIALPLRDMLTSAGAKVVMTRSTDKDVYGPWADDDPELQARCNVGNQANADVFVSIHIDSFSNSSVDGTTAYYYPKTAKDLMLAQMLHQSTMNLLSIPDRGVRSGHLYVNVNTKMPSVLMEMGYISNPHRVQMLTSNWGPKSIAKSLFKGLVDYFAAI